MPVKIFASYSLKKDKSLCPCGGLFYGLGGRPAPEGKTQRAKPKGPDSENNSSQVDPVGLDLAFTQSALGCYGFFYGLSSLQLG